MPPFIAIHHRVIYWLLFLLAGTLLLIWVYQDIQTHRFLGWDDPTYVTHNPHIHSLSLENLRWMLTTLHAANWHPLTWWSLAMDYAAWSLDPFGYKLHNLILHLACGVLVAALLPHLIFLRLKAPGIEDRERVMRGAWLAGLIFLVHPIHVESVVWVSERKDLLCALFYLWSLWCYLRFLETGLTRYRNACLILGVLALFAKPMAISLPAVLILIDLYRSDERQMAPLLTAAWHSARRQTGLILATLLVVVLTIWAQDPDPGAQSDPALNLLNAGYGYWFYASRFFAPHDLSPFYPLPAMVEAKAWYAVLPWIAMGILGVAAWKALQRGQRGWLAVLLCYLVTLLPVIGIVKVGSQSVADRYAYLTTIPFLILLPLLWRRLSQGTRIREGLAMLALFAVVTWLAVQASGMVRVWRNDGTLWQHVIMVSPGPVPLAHIHLGYWYIEEGAPAEARHHWEIAAGPSQGAALALVNLAKLDQHEGRRESARRRYEELVRLHPNDLYALRTAANGLFALGEARLAMEIAERELSLSPASPSALAHTAALHYRAGNHERARELIQILLGISPNDPGALEMMRRIDDATTTTGKALAR